VLAFYFVLANCYRGCIERAIITSLASCDIVCGVGRITGSTSGSVTAVLWDNMVVLNELGEVNADDDPLICCDYINIKYSIPLFLYLHRSLRHHR
jgi:hypothetical protein